MCGWRDPGGPCTLAEVRSVAPRASARALDPQPKERSVFLRRFSTAILPCAAAALFLLASLAPQKDGAPNCPPIRGNTLLSASELKWTPLAGIPGAEQAALVGDSAKEAHRAFFRYPAGLKSPPHTHTWGDRGVIVSGTLSLSMDGAPAKLLGPGSYFSIAAGVRHVTAVEGDAACVFYMEREGPFDVVLAESAPAAKR
jgi:quercetin dioxygenase-like cupin family protein